MTALVIGAAEQALMAALRLKAAEPGRLVDAAWLVEAIKRPDVKRRHMAQMTEQTIELPMGYLVTFSLETQPAGLCRHLSVSVFTPGKVPRPEAVWMIAEALGFTGALERCAVWPEELAGRETAINVVQPFAHPVELPP